MAVGGDDGEVAAAQDAELGQGALLGEALGFGGGGGGGGLVVGVGGERGVQGGVVVAGGPVGGGVVFEQDEQVSEVGAVEVGQGLWGVGRKRPGARRGPVPAVGRTC